MRLAPLALTGLAALACGGAPTSEPEPATTEPVAAERAVAPEVVAPKPVAKKVVPPTARRRAAYYMVLELAKIAELGARMTPDNYQGKCPKSVSWVTWGIAKTDPWGNGFQMTCDESMGGTPLFSSAGPDGRPATADDVEGWKPLVGPEVCPVACKKAVACAQDDAQKKALSNCLAACQGEPHSIRFYVDSCAQLDECGAVGENWGAVADCATSALQGDSAPASCKSFATAAAKTFGGDAATEKKLEKICLGDLLHVSELLCVQESTSASEAALCHLGVNRGWVDLAPQVTGGVR